MKKLITLRIAVLLLGVSLLAACGQTAIPTKNSLGPTVATPTVAPVATSIPQLTPTSPIAVKADACTLLTQADVSKVLGQAVDAGTSKGLGGVCSYSTNNISIDLTVSHTGGIKFMQDTRAKLDQSALDVPGLGDEAFYNVNSYTLFVRKGDAVYMFNYTDSSSQLTQEDRLAKEKALAEQLLSHLS